MRRRRRRDCVNKGSGLSSNAMASYDQEGLPFLDFATAVFCATLVSSKGRHLKSFLYPPQSTFRFLHCRQVGLDSSHLSRFVLQVMQPGGCERITTRSAHCASSGAAFAAFLLRQ